MGKYILVGVLALIVTTIFAVNAHTRIKYGPGMSHKAYIQSQKY